MTASIAGIVLLSLAATCCFGCSTQSNPEACKLFYGNVEFGDHKPQCTHPLIITGLHNSRTSMVTRLLSLLGIWAGRPEDVHISRNNKLKWWERRDTMALNDYVLANHTDPNFPPWVGYGFSPMALSQQERSVFNQNATAIVEAMGDHCPWLMKDPRFCYTAPLWFKVIPQAICVVVYSHPAKVATSLGSHKMKGTEAGADALGWLHRWEDMMEHILRACSSRPTVFIDASLAVPEKLPQFYAKTIPALQRVGLNKLVVPSQQTIQQQVLRHYQRDHVRPGKDTGEGCEYDVLEEQLSEELALDSTITGWNATCSIQPSDSARALVVALTTIVKLQLNRTAGLDPRLIAQTVLKLREELAYAWKQKACTDGDDSCPVLTRLRTLLNTGSADQYSVS